MKSVICTVAFIILYISCNIAVIIPEIKQIWKSGKLILWRTSHCFCGAPISVAHQWDLRHRRLISVAHWHGAPQNLISVAHGDGAPQKAYFSGVYSVAHRPRAVVRHRIGILVRH